MGPTLIELIITEDDYASFKRLDLFLVDRLEESRSRIKNMFDKGSISCTSSTPLILKKMPEVGSTLSIVIPEALPDFPEAEDIPLNILFEDEHLLFINKEVGMVVHPAPGNYTGTLVNALLHHCPSLADVGDPQRPGIVHRLDKGTSGVMVVAKTQECYDGLVELFSSHNIDRKYECIIIGSKVSHAGMMQSTIGRHPHNRLKRAANVKDGKDAVTHFRVIKIYEKMTHLEVTLETGRTHQIRVHVSQLLKMPVLMDPVYGNPNQHLQILGPKVANILQGYDSPLLHAKTLGLEHPITGEMISYTAPTPPIFQKVIEIAQEDKDEKDAARAQNR